MAKGKKKAKEDSVTGLSVTLAEPVKGKKKNKGKKKDGGKGFDALSKLVEHPLVSELLAVGAIAAVGVIAEHRKLGELEASSAKAVKSAGKAAASAIGVRLMKEFSWGSGTKKAPDSKKAADTKKV